jgi:pimeloyl-ACP methyl ester carboxylesterase
METRSVIDQRFLELPSGRTRVQERGEGQAFLWSHALYNAIDVEDRGPLGPMLGRLTGHRVVRYDARGHGSSTPGRTTDAHRWDQLGQDVIALACSLGSKSVVLGGASMGAVATIYAALDPRPPVEISKLVLLLPPTAHETRVRQKRMYRAMLTLSERVGHQALLSTFEQYIGPTTITPGFESTIPHLLEALRAWDPGSLARVIEGAASSDLPPREQLSQIRQPTLVLTVPNDAGHPLSTAELLSKTLPNSTLFVHDRIDAATATPLIQSFLDQG